MDRAGLDHHAHHPVAQRWEQRLGPERLAFCRVTEIGLFRLLTNARVMAGEALTTAEAWNLRDRILSDPRIGFIGESAGFEEHWRRTSHVGRVGPNFWTDDLFRRPDEMR